MAKTKPRTEVLKELMARTYPNRREWILDASAERTVQEIVSEYPLLNKGIYVSVNVNNMYVSLEGRLICCRIQTQSS